MSMDPSGPAPGTSTTPTRPLAGGQTTPEQADRGPSAGVITQQGRPGIYIYPFWQRSEFLVAALTALLVGIVAAVDEGFGAERAWTLITVLAAAYILSRGMAKREPRDDDGDRPWTPGDDSGTGGRLSR
ncbi:MAG TPA: hypothetical protein VM266_13055 [Solirubrobacteraceae bacterium]|nr:hypothetical protein [Solirubrobacteraceae bacterium]